MMRETLSNGAAAGALSVAIVATAVATAEPADVLVQLVQTSSLALKADVVIEVIDPSVACDGSELGESASGSVHYWADGTDWRLTTTMTPPHMEWLNTDLAMSAGTFGYLDLRSGQLDISTASPANPVALGLFNPLFEVAQFALPMTDANSVSPPTLQDLRAAAQAMSLSNAAWTSAAIEGRVLDRADFPGAVYDGVAYSHRVYARPTQRGWPVMIDRADASGKIYSRTRLDHYFSVTDGSGGVHRWPRSIVMETLDPDTGAIQMRMSWIITEIVVNDGTSIPSGVFSIPWANADTVVVDGTIVQWP